MTAFMSQLRCSLLRLRQRTCMSVFVTTSQVGHGKEAFERAKDAVSNWDHFQLDWAQVDPGTPVKTETQVCVESKPLPFLPIWTACPLRIVYASTSIGHINTIHWHTAFPRRQVPGISHACPCLPADYMCSCYGSAIQKLRTVPPPPPMARRKTMAIPTLCMPWVELATWLHVVVQTSASRSIILPGIPTAVPHADSTRLPLFSLIPQH